MDSVSNIERAVAHTGTSCVVTCNCNITHYVEESTHGDYDVGELEQLREKHNIDPCHYKPEYEYGTIEYGYIEGKIFVVGCPSCIKKLERYASWIKAHRHIILDFLELENKDIIEAGELAKEELKTVEKLNAV